MNKHTRTVCDLPTPLNATISQPEFLVDNEMLGGLIDVGVFTLAVRTGMAKRSGHPVKETLFALLLWPLLGLRSIHTFCGLGTKQIFPGGKDALYDFLNRENVNWRACQSRAALRAARMHGLLGSKSALVADDTVKPRRGKKMEGVSGHFDHLQKRTVRGEQVLQLGLAGEKGFLPVDAQIYISSSRPQGLLRPFRDGRSHAARRFREAAQTKIKMLCAMLRRAVKQGFSVTYFLADSWFMAKEVVRTALDCGLTPVLRLKKGNLKFRIDGQGPGSEELTVGEIYARIDKRSLRKLPGLGRKAAHVMAVLDLAREGESPRPHIVQLLFVRGLEPEKGKKSWACFLCSDIGLAPEDVLEAYALRWGIEVYFKEVKQHLGLLKEQTASFASHIASIHLTALRYILLLHAALKGGGVSFGEARDHVTGQMRALTFASLLWALFRALIHGALDALREELGEKTLARVTDAIDSTVQAFLEKALQLTSQDLQEDEIAIPA